jgi:thymidylate synthase (FAD)
MVEHLAFNQSTEVQYLQGVPNRKKTMSKNTQRVELLYNSPIDLAVLAARTCWDSMDKSDNNGPRDIALLKSILAKNHESVIEHVVYTFKIEGFSRAVLQELARHRIASPSVRSTRYTLKKLSKLTDEELSEQFVSTHQRLDKLELDYVKELIEVIKQRGIVPDKFKHKIPESLKFEAVWTINARSLRNFFKLRMSTAALWEIRELAYAVRNVLPEKHQEVLFGMLRD